MKLRFQIVRVIIVIFALFLVSCSGNSISNFPQKNMADSLILIGWDGASRATVKHLLMEKKLPNLQTLIDSGSFVDIEIKQDPTQTKPQWSQILTGYTSSIHGVMSNMHYGPIPKGLTVFERLKSHFGNEFKMALISGKINNVSFRGPHEICTNCVTRLLEQNNKKVPWAYINTKTEIEFAANEAPIRSGTKRIIESREGQPYYTVYQQGIVDYMKSALNEGDNVLKYALEVLEKIANNRFFAFIHFEEPDELGHRFGEGSPEYVNGVIENDRRLGVLLGKLKELDALVNTKIIVMSDHGFDIGRKTHSNAPYTFLVSNIKNLKSVGAPTDIAPTIYKIFGMDYSQYNPSLTGIALQ